MITQIEIGKAIQDALSREIEKAIEDEAKLASDRIVKRIREKSAQIAATVLERMSFERMGQDLIIRINFEGLNKNNA